MNRITLKLVGMLFAGVRVATLGIVAQTPTPQIYTLVTGSQLTDDCPICDRIPIVVPMTGTFGLRLLDENPISTSYELLDISFSAGVNPGPAYQVVGSGTYRIGGEVAVLQDMFLDIEISNGFAKTTALCVNADRALGQQWPKVQINVDQTNGTPGQVYHLTLVAVPALKIHSIVPDHLTGDVHLEWEGSGGKSQLERATNSGGSYLPLTPITTNSSFTDVGVVTNHPQLFYRLHQF